MVIITLSNTKNTQALESNGISLELEMYDQESNTPNQKVDKIVWKKEGLESGVVLFKVKISGYTYKDYELGKLKLKLLTNVNEIMYTVDEKEEVKNYKKRISGYTVINKCIYEPDEELTDTGDINVIVYLVIFFVAIIGIVTLIIFIRNNKSNKK